MAASQSCDPVLRWNASLAFMLLLGFSPVSVLCVTFTLVNSCSYQIWPGISGTPPLGAGGFALAPGQSTVLNPAPGCLVDGYNMPLTVSANGAALDVVATAGNAGGTATTVACATAGCTSNLLLAGAGAGGAATCPAQLIQTNSAGQAVACRSACEAFADPQYCCTGAFSTPQTCGPSWYSQLFKSACPTAYSYAYDDPSSTFTCNGAAGYTITFCPSSS
ncbi:hypothetical protein GOP47_0005474 [Adiantum capillus-veneris]|uniref:Uncharacterized protein n=1 Tax=Adiantum capillus-veneris TaxID=13818 RepID=A0A9D4V556_ADICA|nr:hypothetical protein GOP47_0005474 [Adiantum capillus-veneris]